jgi:hypothetical protein
MKARVLLPPLVTAANPHRQQKSLDSERCQLSPTGFIWKILIPTGFIWKILNPAGFIQKKVRVKINSLICVK